MDDSADLGAMLSGAGDRTEQEDALDVLDWMFDTNAGATPVVPSAQLGFRHGPAPELDAQPRQLMDYDTGHPAPQGAPVNAGINVLNQMQLLTMPGPYVALQPQAPWQQQQQHQHQHQQQVLLLAGNGLGGGHVTPASAAPPPHQLPLAAFAAGAAGSGVLGNIMAFPQHPNQALPCQANSSFQDLLAALQGTAPAVAATAAPAPAPWQTAPGPFWAAPGGLVAAANTASNFLGPQQLRLPTAGTHLNAATAWPPYFAQAVGAGGTAAAQRYGSAAAAAGTAGAMIAGGGGHRGAAAGSGGAGGAGHRGGGGGVGDDGLGSDTPPSDERLAKMLGRLGSATPAAKRNALLKVGQYLRMCAEQPQRAKGLPTTWVLGSGCGFFVSAGYPEDSRRNPCGGKAGPQPVRVAEGTYLVIRYIDRCLKCPATYNKKCSSEGHAYLKVAMMLLAYTDQPVEAAKHQSFKHPTDRPTGHGASRAAAGAAVPGTAAGGAAPGAAAAPVAGTSAGEVAEEGEGDGGDEDAEESADGSAKAGGGDFKLWVPDAPPAVAWHVYEPKSKAGGAQQHSAGTGAGVASGPALGGVPICNKRPRPAQGDAAAGAAAALTVARQSMSPEELDAWLWSNERTVCIPAGVQQPWRRSLSHVIDALTRCVAPVSFRQLLGEISLEDLRAMRCPLDGQGLAHMLVTPPSRLLYGDEIRDPQWNPDEDLPETHAMEHIEALLERIAAEPGPNGEPLGRDGAEREWRRMLEQQDLRHGATVVHRAGRYGHRKRLLRTWVLPYASRRALLTATGHAYMCYHSAYRSTHKEAGRELQRAVVEAALELCGAFSPELAAIVYRERWAVEGLRRGGGADGAAVNIRVPPEHVVGEVVYTLRNKFFTGRNKEKEGYVSPAGQTGHDLLAADAKELVINAPTAAAAAARVAAAAPGAAGPAAAAGAGSPAQAAAALVPVEGPPPPFPRPLLRLADKAVVLHELRNLALRLDQQGPRVAPRPL